MKQAEGARGLGCPGSAAYKRDDGKREALATRDSVTPTRGESFLARTQGPDMLVPPQIIADGNLKYQLSLSGHGERKGQAEGRGGLVERILVLYNFISMLKRKQI